MNSAHIALKNMYLRHALIAFIGLDNAGIDAIAKMPRVHQALL